MADCVTEIADAISKEPDVERTFDTVSLFDQKITSYQMQELVKKLCDYNYHQ